MPRGHGVLSKQQHACRSSDGQQIVLHLITRIRKTWSFILTKKHRLRLLENKVFRKVPGKDVRGSETWLEKTAL
jgi:hypothetical protein